jgi:flagellar motor switch protein FliG
MGKPAADKVLQHFDEGELKKIAQTIAALGSVPRGFVDDLVTEMTESLEHGLEVHGSVDRVEELLTGVVPPEQLVAIMDALKKDTEKPVWSRLDELPRPVLSQYLAKKHPQTAAFIVSRAGPILASSILRESTEEARSELIRRILAMRPASEIAIRILEASLRDDLLGPAMKVKGPPVHARIADIMNKLDRQQMDKVMSDLESRRPKDAQLVKALLFSFDDIARLTPADRVKLFDGVPVERTILALHGVAIELKDLILSSVSARSRRMIEQEISTGVVPPARNIDKARRAIADLVLEMAERGLIDISVQADAVEEPA